MRTQYKKTITPSEVREKGQTVTINRTTNAVRNHLQQLLVHNHPGAKGATVHIVITVEQLTDAGGNPLMTRGADNG